MNDLYIEQHEGSYRIVGSRVTLDPIVHAFQSGLSPETIVTDCFPTLTLAQVYGAIAYYLSHRAEVDAHLSRAKAEFAADRQASREVEPEFYQKLAAARREMLMNQS